jgi:hypothetical protein
VIQTVVNNIGGRELLASRDTHLNDIHNTECKIAELEQQLITQRGRLSNLVASRDAHGEMLDHAMGNAPAPFQPALEGIKETWSHDVDVAPAHGIERPIPGYDTDSWTTATINARILISEHARGAFDGMDSEELEFNFRDRFVPAHFHPLDMANVNWVELARFFGSEE